MSIFIKAGLWSKKKLGFKGELDLTQLIESLIPSPITTTTTTTVAPYKVYSALITQTDSIPQAIVLKNTIGNITFNRSVAGVYTINSSGLFTEDKTSVTINDGTSQNEEGVNNIYWSDENQIILITMILGLQGGGIVKTDGMLNRNYLEIRVYN